jgi:hypothetical protein
MPVGCAQLVPPSVMVEGELELLLLTGHTEEVVGRLELAFSDDVLVTTELESERLVETAAARGSRELRAGSSDVDRTPPSLAQLRC